MKISTFKALILSCGYSICEYVEECETGKNKKYRINMIDILFCGLKLATYNKRLLVEYLPLVSESTFLTELAKKETNLMPNEVYRRKIRVQSQPGDPRSYAVTITDADTGAPIDNVKRVIVYLDIDAGTNQAEVTYYETTPTGGILVGDHGQPVQSIVSVDHLEIDVTAYEEANEIQDAGE